VLDHVGVNVSDLAAARSFYSGALEPLGIKPIMEVEVVTPAEFLGDVMGDLSSRRGKIGGMVQRGDAQVAFTIFVEAVSATQTAVQVNTRMRTDTYTRGSGPPRPRSGLPCASTGRWEANLLDTVRTLLRP